MGNCYQPTRCTLIYRLLMKVTVHVLIDVTRWGEITTHIQAAEITTYIRAANT